jgi:hypothetical protein
MGLGSALFLGTVFWSHGCLVASAYEANFFQDPGEMDIKYIQI